MRCPICHKEVEDKKYRPFCSKRCADIDLANWFNEKYSFQAVETDEKDLEELEKVLEKQEEND
ncbi:MAG: DNA gyrase inhibitor YacG [bacterium]|nr:DNA gyrase inhibitor YacG [bacterium]MDY2830357.1 DNA gyrase inhibitor YacG [Alphaproteobacteria bacterium]